MRTCVRTLLLAACLALPCSTSSAQPAPHPVPATHPVDVANVVLPELRLDTVSLSDVLDFIRDTVPGFQCVLAPDGGRDPNTPVTMRLRGVTVRQFFDILCEAYPGVSVKVVPGDNGGVWVVHLGAPKTGGPLEGAEMDTRTKTRERIFPLAPAIDALEASQKSAHPGPTTLPDRASRLKDVMSLLHEATGDDPRLVNFKVHAPTEVLIATGSPDHLDAIYSALAALAPAAYPLQSAQPPNPQTTKDVLLDRVRVRLAEILLQEQSHEATLVPNHPQLPADRNTIAALKALIAQLENKSTGAPVGAPSAPGK